MQKKLAAHIEDLFPEMREDSFLVACSGGIDSVALTRLLKALNCNFELAHCNFELRARESDKDAAFVSDLAQDLDLELHLKNFKTKRYAESSKQSIQEAARELRYRWFRELLSARSLAFVVTAHHADDVLETFLINLVRGTGLEGLTGIPERAPWIRRPLLPFSAGEIRSYAKKAGWQWREDSSNVSDAYLRNRLRKRAVPGLKESDPRFLENFRKTLGFLQGSQALVQNHIESLRESFFHEENGVIRIPVSSLTGLQPRPPYLYELFHRYGFSDWVALDRLLEGPSGKQLFSTSHALLRDREALFLKERNSRDRSSYEVDPEASRTEAPIVLELTDVTTRGPASQNTLYLDRETLKEGLQLRKWQKGDYFYPLGMEGKQKVSKYFKDHKFNQFEKEAQWLLCSGDDIVWIVGHRADERFKVRKGTSQILRIEWKDSEET